MTSLDSRCSSHSGEVGSQVRDRGSCPVPVVPLFPRSEGCGWLPGSDLTGLDTGSSPLLGQSLLQTARCFHHQSTANTDPQEVWEIREEMGVIRQQLGEQEGTERVTTRMGTD